MRYYTIQYSNNLKIIGKYPQTKSIKYNCHVWDDPRFIEHVHFEKIDFEPITANAILQLKSKQTDLINTNSSIGFSKKLLVSEKLKTILLKNRATGLQFFRAPIIQNNLIIEDYWILNMYEFNNDYVDISKSKVFYNKKAVDYKLSFNTIKEQIYFDTFQQFEQKKIQLWSDNEEIIIIEKINLHAESIKEDFFMIDHIFGKLFFISERLKQEIEETGCSGIEFQPIELSYNEWTASEGERERVYGKIK